MAVEVEVTAFAPMAFAAPSGAIVAILQLIALDLAHRHLLPSLLLLLPFLLPFHPILLLCLLLVLVGVALVVAEAEVMEFAPIVCAAPSGATVAILQLIALDLVHRHLLPTLLLPLLAGAQLLT